MPSMDQLTYAISGGCTINDSRSEEYIWTRSIEQGSTSAGLIQVIALEVVLLHQVSRKYTDPGTASKCRCVR